MGQTGVPALSPALTVFAAMTPARGRRAASSADLMLMYSVLEFWLHVAIFMPSIRRTTVHIKGLFEFLVPGETVLSP